MVTDPLFFFSKFGVASFPRPMHGIDHRYPVVWSKGKKEATLLAGQGKR